MTIWTVVLCLMAAAVIACWLYDQHELRVDVRAGKTLVKGRRYVGRHQRPVGEPAQKRS